jgi:sarcosine oxidase subunit alpha
MMTASMTNRLPPQPGEVINRDRRFVVPPEASQIVRGTTIVGRITTSRMSPTLWRSICMALVSEDLSQIGTSLTVRLPDGRHVPAQVAPRRIHFDPEGTRLRG